MWSTDGVKRVRSVRIVPNQRAGACIMSMLLGMNAVQHLRGLVSLVVPQGVPAQRNHGFEVTADCATMNADACAHQSMFAFWHLQTFTLLP